MSIPDSMEIFQLDKNNYVQSISEFFHKKLLDYINQNGSCLIGLSGGSTPFPIYSEIGKYTDINWDNVTFFLVDERYVPETEKTSNQGQIFRTLCGAGNIKKSSIIFPDTSLPLEECVENYNKKIEDLYKTPKPTLLIMGMGDDGHFASIFPALDEKQFNIVRDKNVLVAHTNTDLYDVFDRVTITYQVIERAKELVFLLRGKKKWDIWNEMIASNEDERRWPAKSVISKIPCKVFVSVES